MLFGPSLNDVVRALTPTAMPTRVQVALSIYDFAFLACSRVLMSGCAATVFNCLVVVQACFIAFLFLQPLCEARWVCRFSAGVRSFSEVVMAAGSKYVLKTKKTH